MEFSITYISKNRKLGKSYRRIYSEIEKLNYLMAENISSFVNVNRVEFWLVDKPLDYLQIVKKNGEFIEIHSGVDESLSYSPDDDVVFLKNIKTNLDKTEALLRKVILE